MKHFRLYFISWLFLVLGSFNTSFGLVGDIGTHDPSAIMKDGDTYYFFRTGGGIPYSTSKDLIKWSRGSSVFGNNYPKWINDHVAAFNGNFWAPGVIYMNSKYHIYYSACEWDTYFCTVGVASSPTLNPKASNYKWTDHGHVAHSTNRNDVTPIDASAFRDDDGKIYLNYGGLRGAGNIVVEIDSLTAKIKEGHTPTKIGGAAEGTAIFKMDNWYYFMLNRGSCCSGVKSTYYINAGRSRNPLGPYVDKNGTNLIQNPYGSAILRKSGKYIGPGHFALYRENGVPIVSLHYYDGSDDGHSKIDIATVKVKDGWPVITRDWLDAGTYYLINQNTNKAMSPESCNGLSNGSKIVQENASTSSCQQWELNPVGDGFYQIAHKSSGLALSVEGCKTGNNSKIILSTKNSSSECQKIKIERASDGSFVLTPSNTSKVVEVPGGVTNSKVQLALYDYNDNNQRWVISTNGELPTSSSSQEVSSSSAEPVCEAKVEFYAKVNEGEWLAGNSVEYSMDDKLVIGPHPVSGSGIWQWRGPKTYAASTREVSFESLQMSDSGSYSAKVKLGECEYSAQIQLNYLPGSVRILEPKVNSLQGLIPPGKKGEINVFNMLGALQFSQIIDSGADLQYEALVPGVYFLELKVEGKVKLKTRINREMK